MKNKLKLKIKEVIKNEGFKNENSNVKALNNIKLLYITLFLMLIFYLIYFIFFTSGNLIINAYNPRLEILQKNIVRGKILDKNKEVIAETVNFEGEDERVYPYANIFSHIVGYSHQGKTGIEALADIDLIKSNMSIPNRILYDLMNKKKLGNNIVTTLDKDLQQKAYELMGNSKGAFVALEPSTGKILSMISKPDFNPNEISMDWEKLLSDEKNFPLLNRSTQGLYPPGSTFKILTAMAYHMQNPEKEFIYTCMGEDNFDGKVIHCYNNRAHGEQTLEKAFANSCNTAFAKIGEDLDINQLKDLADQLLFNKTLPYSLPYSMSSYDLTDQNNSAQKAETVIGQGTTMISPLHNALIVSTIANGGILMKPYLIDRVENNDGKVIHKNMPSSYGELIDTDLTRLISQYMSEVMISGTGVKGSSELFQIAGKTGSAENPFGNSHAWFVGFAPAQNPEIVMIILLENDGTSSNKAVPMAKELFEAYLSDQK